MQLSETLKRDMRVMLVKTRRLPLSVRTSALKRITVIYKMILLPNVRLSFVPQVPKNVGPPNVADIKV
jgi:hypothetical protein